MRAAAALKALGPIDLKSIARDSLLPWIIVSPIGTGLLMRWATPPISAWTTRRFEVSLEPYYGFMMSTFVFLAPWIVGNVIGFLLLDERDDDTLTALLVTPLPPQMYLAYRIGVPLLVCSIVTLISFEIAHLVSMSWLRLVPIAVVGSLSGPLLSLALATVAENKVQGFAVVKALGTLMTPAVVAYFIATPWQYIAGILPLYWPLKAFWLAHEGGAPWVPFLLVGLVYQLALLALLLRRFRRVLHR